MNEQINALRTTEASQAPDFITKAFQLSWRLLPPGIHSFKQILQYFEHLQLVHSESKYEPERLRKIHKLGPDEVYVGLGVFQGYVVFVFNKSQKAVLECPLYGNAIYIIQGKWEFLSSLSKNELLTEHPSRVNKITHSGNWFERVKEHLVLS